MVSEMQISSERRWAWPYVAWLQAVVATTGSLYFSEVMHLPALDKPTGQLRSKDGTLLGYAKTPGYETYRGMGWFGVVTLRPSPPAQQPPPAVP